MHTLIWIGLVLLIVGVVVWALDRIPAIDPALKGFVRIGVIAGAVIWALLTLYRAFGR